MCERYEGDEHLGVSGGGVVLLGQEVAAISVVAVAVTRVLNREVLEPGASLGTLLQQRVVSKSTMQ